MPFGKHRGKLLEEVATKRGYCLWLFDQPWFTKDHPDLYKVLKDLVALNKFMREARISDY